MVASKRPKQIITIGNRTDDAELIDKILKYQKKRNLPTGAAAVRELCEDAIKFKEASR